MKKYHPILLTALAALSIFSTVPARADNMASIAITPATGAVTLVPQWSIGGNLAGFHHMSQDLGLTGSVANNFYSITSTGIPPGGDILAFQFYVAGSGSATAHADIGSKLTPDSYLALTSADPDVGFGSVNLYFIHRKGTTDYFTAIIPGSGTSSAVTDLKPMDGPGGPATLGTTGYFGLTFAAANLGYGLNNFYYLRTDPVTLTTKFGTLEPALLGTSADKFDLGTGGHKALVFTGADVGYGTDKMYYLRLDPITGFTILGMLDPALAGVRHTSDIANLGSVYKTLAFVPGDVGFGSNQFYATGSVNATAQTVSFAAIADRAIATGSFNVNPTASSALPIALTVVSGSVGAASIANVGGGVFTVTPTAPGLITLQATQAGQAAPLAPVFEFNMLRQSFTISGSATLAITTQPTAQSAVTGTTANFTVAASGTTAVTFQWRKAGTNITSNASATTATLSLTNVQAGDQASYDVAVTNASGTIFSNSVTLTVTAPAPVITNSPLTASGTVGAAFSFTITASGTPTSFSASGLPAGLTVNTTTGAITGTPTTAASSSVTLGATNSIGTGNATLTITVSAAPPLTPVITNSPLTASGTVGVAFSFGITASGTPTSFSASGLPAGLTVNTTTGAITGTPTTAATSSVTLGATNVTGTGNATLTITVSAVVTPPPPPPPPAAPTIVIQPVNRTVPSGQSTTYTVDVGNDPSISIQWQRLPFGGTNFENLVEGGSYRGVRTATLTVTSTSPAASGDQFRAILTRAGLTTTSTTVTLTVTGGETALFQYPGSIAADAAGNLYVADTFTNTIRKITTAGVVSTLAGSAGTAGTANGTGAAARFNQPAGVAVDTAGNVYVADTGNATIRKITPDGTVTNLAGTANVRGNRDDFGSAASFGSPIGIAVDTAGNVYVADAFNATIRKITPAGSVSTLAGTATLRGIADGTGAAARFNSPSAVAVDAAGTVYVADTSNATIRKITAAGVVSTLAGLPGVSGADNGTGILALFNQPFGIAVDASGNVFVADTASSTIRKITASGAVTTIAGVPGIAGFENGSGNNSLFNQPRGLVVVGARIFVADTGNSTIRQIAANNDVTTVSMSAAPAGSTTTPPVNTTTTTAGSGSSRGGGGGAPSPLFLAVLALLGISRLWFNSAAKTKPTP